MTSLNHLPIDIMREICQYLPTDSVIQLYATLNKRIQFSLAHVGFSSSLSLCNPLKSTSGEVSYFIHSVPTIQSISLNVYHGLSETALLALSDRPMLHTLEVHRTLIDVMNYYIAVKGDYDPSKRYIPLIKTGALVALNWSVLFPALQSLSILSALSPIVYELAGIKQDSITIDERNVAIGSILQNFPPSLTKLHLVLGKFFEWTAVEVMQLLPKTLSDIYIDVDGAATQKDNYMDIADLFPRLKILRLFFLPQVAYIPTKNIRLTPMPLEELHLSSFNALFTAIGTPYMPLRHLVHLHTLVLWFDAATRSPPIHPVDLSAHLPALHTFKLLRLSRTPRTGPGVNPIASLPVNLTHFEVSTATGPGRSNFQILCSLEHTAFLTVLIETKPSFEDPDPIPWEILPKSLTRLEMQGFGLVEHRIDASRTHFIQTASDILYDPLTDDDLLTHMANAPPGLKVLKCPVISLRYLHAFHLLFPDCHVEDSWFGRLKTSLDHVSWLKMEQFGCFDQTKIITDEWIVQCLATVLGPNTKASFSMPSTARPFQSARRELVQELKIGSAVLTSHQISVDFSTLHSCILKEYPRLTELDFWTRMELDPALLPKSLTSLHLRHTLVSGALLSACFDMKPLTSFRAHGKIASVNMAWKTVKRWKIFDVPQLVISSKRIPLLLSDDLEDLCFSVSSIPDTELERIMSLTKPNAKIRLSCSILISGKLVDPSIEHITYRTLIDSVYNAFTPRGVTITDMSMKNLSLPDGIKSMCFDNLDLPSYATVRSELFTRFPDTLRILTLRNTGFEISWRKLSAILPAGLEHFYCLPLKEMHSLDSICPLNALQTLAMEWPSGDGGALTSLSFNLSSMVSLTCLELVNVQITYPLRDVTQALSNLKKIRIPKIDDCDIRIVFHDHPNIESVHVDTLNLSGACLPDRKCLDWPFFVEGSLSVVLPIVAYKRIMLAQPILFAQSNIEEICFHHTSSEAFMESKPEIADQIRTSDLMIFHTDLPPLLTKLDFSSASKIPVTWFKCLSVLSKAVNLQWAKLDLLIDLTVEASHPLLPSQLTSLFLPLAQSSKKGGSGLLLPPSLTELYAPLLAINPSTHTLPNLDILEIANIEYVKRMLGYASAAATSQQKAQRNNRES